MSQTPLPDELPDHLQDFNHLETLPDLESAATTAVEAQRVSTWELCDLCAVARIKFGKSSTNVMASLLGYTGQTVRRYQKAGALFPPEYRYPETTLTVYYTAAELADDPIAALHHAVDNHLTERELKDWLKGGGEQGKDVALTEWRELFHIDESATVEMGVWFLRTRQRIVVALQQASLMDLILDDACELRIKVQVTGVFPKETGETPVKQSGN